MVKEKQENDEKPKAAETPSTPQSTTQTAPPALPATDVDAVCKEITDDDLKTIDEMGYGKLFRSLIRWMKGVDVKFLGVAQFIENVPTAEKIAAELQKKIMPELQAQINAVGQQNLATLQAQINALGQAHPGGQSPSDRVLQTQGSEDADARTLKMLLGTIGGEGGGGDADKYFRALGMETASMSHFMTKEMFKTMMPKAFAEWEKSSPLMKKAAEAAEK